MTGRQILRRARELLGAAHGSRLKGVVLYGSQARQRVRADSDVDLLVLLEDPIDYARDLQTNIEALYPLSAELPRRISAKPVSTREYQTTDCPLYRRARAEGIPA